MKLISLFAALISFAAADIDGPASNNGGVAKSTDAALVDLPLILDGDWTNFYFTNAGVPVIPNFIIATPIYATLLEVTDLYCAGDVFTIANNGVFFATTNPAVFTDCQLSTTNATLAFEVPYWSSTSQLLLPALVYNLTIIPSLSPWSAGQAAIRWVSAP
jgi:hypothetical protein